VAKGLKILGNIAFVMIEGIGMRIGDETKKQNLEFGWLLLDDMIKNSLASVFVNQIVMLHFSCFRLEVVMLHLSSQ
jgi:hypothetical protein